MQPRPIPKPVCVSGKTFYYNKYFGINHFKGRPYYRGHHKNDNYSHYDLLSAGGMDSIVIYVEYDAADEDRPLLGKLLSSTL
jgi:hypothetical protein